MSEERRKEPVLKRGAQQHVVNAEDRRRNWLHHHVEVAQDCIKHLCNRPISSFITMLVLGVALAIPSFLFTVLLNVERISSYWEGDNELSLYLKVELTNQEVESVSQRLLLRPDLIAVDLIDAQQGLIEFRELTGFDNILSSLDENPIPAVISVLPKDDSVESLQRLKEELSVLVEVEKVVLDLDWIQRFNAIISLIQRVVIIFSLLLGFAVLLVIGNTIRMNVERRREEIQVSKLIGATNAWVRRPFLYLGIYYGLFSALIALIIIEFSLVVLKMPMLQLAQLYQSDFQLAGLGFWGMSLLFTLSIFLGWFGALLSANKFLAKLDPK